jgi:hypothetical protein
MMRSFVYRVTENNGPLYSVTENNGPLYRVTENNGPLFPDGLAINNEITIIIQSVGAEGLTPQAGFTL